jgi:hypothetical protein
MEFDIKSATRRLKISGVMGAILGFGLMLMGFISMKNSTEKGYVWVAFGAISFSSGLVKIFKAKQMGSFFLCPACQAVNRKTALRCEKCGQDLDRPITP